MRGTPKELEAAMKDLSMITGQWPVNTKAKKSVASFKIREGNTIGIAVTLRGRIMFNFLDRLTNLGLPRTMDFLGVNPNSFDGHGNVSMFPEILYEVGGKKNGMDVCIVTTAKTDNEALRLLTLLGMPFRREHPVWRGDPEEEVEAPPPHEQGQGKAVKAKFVSDIEWMVSLSIACCSCCTYRQKTERKSFVLVRLFILGVSETRMFIWA